MTNVDPAILHNLSTAVLAALRRSGRLPTRLDEEDYDDLIQEGIIAGLQAMHNHDPNRGNVNTFLRKPMERAQLRAAWRIANVGMTGDVTSVQVWSIDGASPEIEAAVESQLVEPDVAEVVEAFDSVWETHYRE